MSKENIEIFKSKLKDYRIYYSMFLKLNERLSNLWYELEGVKAIQYDKEPSSHNNYLIQERKYALSEKIKEAQAQINSLNEKLSYIDCILEKMQPEIRDTIIDIYINKKSIRKAAKKCNISHTALLKRINKEIARLLDSNEY